jgi:cathepsin B
MKYAILLVLCVFALTVSAIRPVSNLLGDEAPAIDTELIAHVNSVQSSWKAGHNKRFQGLKVKDIKKLCGTEITGVAELPIKHVEVPSALPDTFDARTQWPGCIGAIRDQGHCGSCWAFGAVEALSDRFCIQSKGASKPIIAAQDPTSCDTSNGGCNGGQLGSVWRYLANTGAVTESCYPYEMGTCKHPGCSELPTPACKKACQASSTLNYATDKHHAVSAYSIARNVTQIATEIMTNGPVEAAFTVYTDFNNYVSGVYHHVSGTAEGGHAIKIIGWGTESGTDYWLVANSWNTDWGDNGFFKIRRGTNECGIEAQITAGLAKV